MIHYFPMKPSEDRWTGFMDRAIVAYLDKKQTYRRYHYNLQDEWQQLAAGSFYDPRLVTEYRSRQLAEFSASDVKNGDIAFFSDVLVPGVEAVAYMAHMAELNVRIRGLLHAGSFTEYDIMQPVEHWAAHHEIAVLAILEEVYVGSEYIANDLVRKRAVHPDKIIVTGFPLDDRLPEPAVEREQIVVFNGRHSPDKQPWLFKALADRLYSTGATFVDTQENRIDKPDYYQLLAKAKVVVSFALQEMFGTGVQEAVRLGCVPVVPNGCCYPEQFDQEYLYSSFDEAVSKVNDALQGRLFPPAPDPDDHATPVARWFK